MRTSLLVAIALASCNDRRDADERASSSATGPPSATVAFSAVDSVLPLNAPRPTSTVFADTCPGYIWPRGFSVRASGSLTRDAVHEQLRERPPDVSRCCEL